MAEIIYKDDLFWIQHGTILWNLEGKLNPNFWYNDHGYIPRGVIPDGGDIPRHGLMQLKITDPNAEVIVGDRSVRVGHLPYIRVYSGLSVFNTIQLKHAGGAICKVYSPRYLAEFWCSWQRLGDKFLQYNNGQVIIKDEITVQKMTLNLMKEREYNHQSATQLCYHHRGYVPEDFPAYCICIDERIIIPKSKRLPFENHLRRMGLNLGRPTPAWEEITDPNEKKEITREAAIAKRDHFDMFIDKGLFSIVTESNIVSVV